MSSNLTLYVKPEDASFVRAAKLDLAGRGIALSRFMVLALECWMEANDLVEAVKKAESEDREEVALPKRRRVKDRP